MTDCLNLCDSRLLITDLPEDVVTGIFEYLDFKTLLTLAQVCRCFNVVASKDSLWRPILQKCVNSIQRQSQNKAFSVKDCCQIAFKWSCGQYSETTHLDFHKKLLPWLQLTKNTLYISKENGIKMYNIHRGKKRSSKPFFSFVCGPADITRFVVKKDLLVGGCMGKTVSVWDQKDKLCHNVMKLSGHTKTVYCVDVFEHIVLSGSRDRSIKIWSLHSGECITTIHVGDPVRSMAVNSFDRTFAAGSAGYLDSHSPLRLFDCETGWQLCELICDSTSRRGAGVLDIKFESPNILLSCGYDTAVRLWDIRTNSRCCVKKWEDPHDSTVYCIDSDKRWMILSGTNRYGLVRLWDKRMDRSVKYYYVNRHSTSPVYSLRFNQTKLFAALDRRVNVLNFES